MDGLTLLREARRAGLAVTADGGRLVVEGPRRAETVALELIAHKSEVLAALKVTHSARATRPAAQKTSDARHTAQSVTQAAHDFDSGAHAPADATDATDLIELFHERVAIRQYDGRWPGDLAERLAFAECLEIWCKRHSVAHDPVICAGCGKTLSGEALDLPDGARVHFNGQRFECLINYGFARKERAVKALAAMGLVPPPGWEP